MRWRRRPQPSQALPDGRYEPVRLQVDPVLLGAVLGLLSLGLVMVYSASAVTALEKTGNGFYFLERQLVAAALGLLAMATVLKLGYRRLARLAYPLLVLTVLLLVLVQVPGVGTLVGGARRWIRFPGVSIQPAEIAKFTWVVYLAYSLAKKREKVASFSIGFLPHLLLGGLLVGLCMAEPDFGSAVELLVLLFVLLFAAGTKLSYLVGSVLLALPLAYHAVAHSPYRLARIRAFLDPWAHRHDVGYQVAQSLISVGSGGFFGLGLGESRQKLFFLPEAHTDFIFSIVGEELGLFGAAAMVLLYGVIVWRGTRAALRAQETFGTYLGLGLTALLGAQAVVNMSVAMGMLPTKGLTLPFVSYGGCSLVVSMTAAGALLSLSAATAPMRVSGPRPRTAREALA
jgi:cell division protein FtsW